MEELLLKALPFLGTALGGPLAGGAISFIESKLGLTSQTKETVQKVLTSMVGDPVQIAKAQELESQYRDHALTLGFQSQQQIVDANIRALEATNKTMQVEAASDHWPTYSWRPFIGFMFGGYIFSFAFAPYFKLVPPQLDPTLVGAVGAILGIASYFRGKMQSDPAVPTDNRG